MKDHRKILVILFSFFISAFAFAQVKTITGKVTNSKGTPQSDVSVTVKETGKTTYTNANGEFVIEAEPGQTVDLESYDSETGDFKVGTENTYSFQLKVSKAKKEETELGEVVVTALGIKRDKKALNYSTQQLNADQINSSPTTNFVNNLAGKVAGLDVKMNSNFGGSTNIVMRGIRSITGNNQALIVVDGVPISNANLNTSDALSGRDGFDFGNAASDIDPNNIESVNVLKGAAATALYGSLASNGAIMITTKKGKINKALGVSLSSTVSVGEYDKSTFAKYQKRYGEGYSGENSSYFVDVNGDGIDDLVASTADDASYGNAFDPSLMVYQWDAFNPQSSNYGKATPWVAAKNGPGSFFQKSLAFTNNVTLNGGDQVSTYNFSFTNNNESGIMPNSKLNKNTISGNYTKDFSDKLKATSFFTFSNQNTTGRNAVGYGDNFMTGFRQWWPINVDIKELKQLYFNTRTNATWNQNDPTSGDISPAFWDNPYWYRYENYESDSRTRFLTGGTLSYDVTKEFNILARVGVDYSHDKQELRKNIGSHAEEFGVSQIDETSGYDLFTRNFMQQNYDLIASYSFTLGSDFNGKATAGYNFIKSNMESSEASTTGGLLKPGLYSLENSKVFLPAIESDITYKKSGVYGQLSLDYLKTVFLEGSYRYDKSTALASGNNGYGYWSLGTSIVLSQWIKTPWLSFSKIRASYAQVGNDPVAGRFGYYTNNYSIGNAGLYSNPTTYTDYNNIKSELSKSWEAGLEAQFLNNRLGFDVTFYKTNSEDQVISVPTTGASGYLYKRINAGELENKGVEVTLNFTPIKTTSFKWDMNVNWSTNRNKLVKLEEGRDNLVLARFQLTSLNATVGKSYGTIRGTDYVYQNGQRVVEDGYYLTNDDQVLGNIQPDWIGGVYNKFTYKNFSFGFLIDVRKGGDVFSLDQAYGQGTGLYPNTAGNNDLGNPVRNPVTSGADSGGVILKGINADGTPNTVRIDGTEYGGIYGSDVNPEKAYVYDGSFVKLREASISYSLPQSVLSNTKIQDVIFSVIGNNLWIIHKNLPMADPEAGSSSGNIQGYQTGVMPTVRTVSFNVKINF